MSDLGDGLNNQQLAEQGFVIDPANPTRAKHERYNSVRSLCADCNLWFKQVRGNQYCHKCGKARDVA